MPLEFSGTVPEQICAEVGSYLQPSDNQLCTLVPLLPCSFNFFSTHFQHLHCRPPCCCHGILGVDGDSAVADVNALTCVNALALVYAVAGTHTVAGGVSSVGGPTVTGFHALAHVHAVAGTHAVTGVSSVAGPIVTANIQ